MARTNPQVIPRNHQIEAVIQAGVGGDFDPIHQMLAAILLDRDLSLNRDDLLQKTNLMRGDAKDQISSESMTLDGLTVSEINDIYDKVPKLPSRIQ